MRELRDRCRLHQTAERSFPIGTFEFRDDSEETITFEGVASVVDKPYSVRDMYGEFEETIRSGSFTKTLRDSKADVALFVNHQSRAIPLATRNAGNLELRADPDLHVTATLNPRRHDVQDVREAVKDGQLRQMSIGFEVPKGKDAWNDDYTERTIHEVKLIETSIVWRGANPHTEASVRGLATLDELRAYDGPLDAAEARRIIAHLEALVPDLRDLNGWTLSDLRPILCDAICDQQVSDACYVIDVSDTWFVYQDWSGMEAETYQVDYTITADGAVTLGTPVEVIAKTTYLPDPDTTTDTAEAGMGVVNENAAIPADMVERMQQLWSLHAA